MLHQVMMSGNIKKGNSPIIEREDAQRVIDHVTQCGYTGFTVYIDGNYLTLYEGSKKDIEDSINYYADSERYSKITTMISQSVDVRKFNDFKLCLRNIDCNNVFGNVDKCVLLTPSYLQNVLPQDIPNEYKTLLKTFARVNNMTPFSAVA